MLVLLPVAACEVERAIDLLDWCYVLDGVSAHELVTVFANPVTKEDRDRVLETARKAFAQASGLWQTTEQETGWPTNANALFRSGASYATKQRGLPFLWWECDAIPTQEGWLDKIAAEYARAGKPFMGCVYPLPRKHLNGVMVYPANVAQFNPYMLNSSITKPWDVIRPEINMQRGAHTPLIVRSLADPATNTPHTFLTQESLSVIPPQCVLFHGNKDGTLIARLRESLMSKRMAVETVKRSPLEEVAMVAKRTLKGVLRMGRTYYHSGNLGDVIYGLNAIKLAGGGKLIIGPQQRGTSPCGNPISKSQFDVFQPLLSAQPYLEEVTYSEKYPANGTIDYDLNTFRNHWNDPDVRRETGINTLCRMHCHTLGVNHLMSDSEPWLIVPNPIETDRIIVQRSPRYHSDQPFPWAELVKRFGDKMMFVGLENEWRALQTLVGQPITFCRVADLLEMARFIAGARLCIMNQSFPASLALATGKPLVMEEWPMSPDCRFDRDTYCGHLGKGGEDLMFFAEYWQFAE